ncbi:MAG: hypothetical protein HY456_01230 [Parcubacteria group bacterium]|nr:hypothetical protein [Parcubacteria group bacterium]
MFRNSVKFIRELQESDEGRKKRWLLIFVVPSMLIVIAGWFFALQASFSTDTAVVEGSKPSEFFQVFKRGLAVIKENLNQRFYYSSEVKPQDYVPGNVDPVPPQKIQR